MASLRLEGVCKKFPGGITAVSNFNLEINQKEFVILVGPSGCGKSTTLRMIAGLEEITEGQIYIEDRLINDVPPKDRDIAMVFQNYALYPHMTVFENIGFALKLRKIPKDEIKQKVEEVAKILGITSLLKRKPKELSGGQRQRVAVGRAIVRQPKLFLFDEPLSNLDAKLRSQMRIEIIKLYQKFDTTFVYVTHDQVEAMTMGTKIVVMKDALIQQIDTPQNLYRKPCNLFVAGFIGSPQMNFIDVIPIEKERTIWLKFGSVEVPLTEEKAALTRPYLGQIVVMGIRPEDISDRPEILEKYAISTIEAEVEVSELMGAEVLLYLTCQGERLIAKVDSDSYARIGEKKAVAIDYTKINLFDKKTEEAIFNV